MNCYAESVAARFSGPGQPYEGLAKTVNGHPRWTNKIMLARKHLDDPLHWRKPRRVFVNSMSDLFHPDVPDSYIHEIFEVMCGAARHQFQVLTKRPERMKDYCLRFQPNPLPNVWLGTSVEHQSAAEERIPYLIDTPAAIRFLSVEPMLGPVILDMIARRSPYHYATGTLNALTGEWWPALGIQPGAEAAGRFTDDARINWVIVGGESGPNHRFFNPDWARSIRDQCVAAEVPFFFKQHGGLTPKSRGKELDGREWCEMPKSG
jgi:protein gp37